MLFPQAGLFCRHLRVEWRLGTQEVTDSLEPWFSQGPSGVKRYIHGGGREGEKDLSPIPSISTLNPNTHSLIHRPIRPTQLASLRLPPPAHGLSHLHHFSKPAKPMPSPSIPSFVCCHSSPHLVKQHTNINHGSVLCVPPRKRQNGIFKNHRGCRRPFKKPSVNAELCYDIRRRGRTVLTAQLSRFMTASCGKS